MPKEILITDSTMRDGQHALKHQLSAENIADYARGAEKAGIRILFVGHGNGMGASSLQVGQSLLSDQEMLVAAKKELVKTKLGSFLIPGFGTIAREIKPAIENGLESLMVACNCTEADITRQHIEYAKANGLQTIGVLMMSHNLDAKGLLEQAKKMQSYGADGVLLMDSAGSYLPDDVTGKVGLLADKLKIMVGFHGHNNLGMAIFGSIAAVKAGASFIDATSRGLGAGAGNCQLEVLVAVLEKLGYSTGLDVRQLANNSEEITAKIMAEHHHQQVIDRSMLASGLAGIFSGFRTHVQRAAKEYGVEEWDIYMDLGKLKAVAGQEDLIIQVAKEIKDAGSSHEANG